MRERVSSPEECSLLGHTRAQWEEHATAGPAALPTAVEPVRQMSDNRLH